LCAGLGVSLISESFARDEVQSGKVKLIALKDNELTRELGMAYRRNRSLPRAAEVFIELLQRGRRSRDRRRPPGLPEDSSFLILSIETLHSRRFGQVFESRQIHRFSGRSIAMKCENP